MQPFSSSVELLAWHQVGFGAAGLFVGEALLRLASLFPSLNPLGFRVVLAPVELGPYNKHAGYTYTEAGFILGNRHICKSDGKGGLILLDEQATLDFIVHELAHSRQAQLLPGHNGYRGVHRDAGWYGAIAEATPEYLGVSFPESIWPKMRSVRKGKEVVKVQDRSRITEVETTHWPHSFRELIARGDPRLVPLTRFGSSSEVTSEVSQG
jgi:hypothetical protein